MLTHPLWCKGRDFNDERSMLEQYGFFCHMVPPEKEGGPANLHTHGIPASLDHPDVQVTMFLPPNVFGPIIHSVYDKIKEGTKLETGVQYDWVLDGMLVEFAWATENERDVLRMILPDKEGNTSKDTIALPYGNQLVGTFDNPEIGVWEVEEW